MPRGMRILIVIAVMTLVGLGVLTWMARRYATMMNPPPPPSTQS